MQDQGRQVGGNPMFHFAVVLILVWAFDFCMTGLHYMTCGYPPASVWLTIPDFLFLWDKASDCNLGPSLTSNSRQSSCLTLWVLEIPVGATLSGFWLFSVEKKKSRVFTNHRVISFGAPLVQCYYLNVLTCYFKERISFILDVFPAPNSSWCRVIKGILRSCQLPLHSCRLQGLWACLSVQPLGPYLLWGSSSSLWESHGLIIQVLELKLKE